MPSIPDDATPASERKPTVINDLPARDEADDAANVKGGATIVPCVRVPRLDPGSIIPCIRPGGVG